MTGPGHYRAAEEILDSIRPAGSDATGLCHPYLDEADAVETRDWMILAQVHATLALAAATALGTASPDSDPGAEWWDATHDGGAP
jgi:hypothetical protein